ncbi:MAG: sigma-70 family RNA polymerase sigma factor [Symbiobacterium sp.]|uniref:RNA polymerase sigma factor n=1 Tax=Symbiobacterium sp. TaxID=1971213 RepID=UPI003464BD07
MARQAGLNARRLPMGDESGSPTGLRLTAANEEALGMMMERYGGALLQYAHRLVGDIHTAEEICQDTLLKAWQHGDRFRQEGHLQAWLFRVARNRAIDLLRRRRYAAEEPLGHSVSRSPGHLEEEAERALMTEALLGALAELSPQYRVVIELRFFRDLGYREIAERLAIPIGTVKSRLNYGLKGLARILERRRIAGDVCSN